MCEQTNNNIASLQTIVTALQGGDYVTGVIPVTKNGENIGYTISFTKSAPITIYHGENGKDGTNGSDGKDGVNGADGHTPIIGVRKDTDGIYYWTLDGDWLLDNTGNKVRAEGRKGQDGVDGKPGDDGQDGQDGKPGAAGKDGITPQLKIENGYWFVSTDNGATWTNLGKATGEDGKPGAAGKDGITPQLKIENGYWFVSTDNGTTWTNLGKATGEDGEDGKDGTDGKDGVDGDSMFSSVTVGESEVTFILADGGSFSIPKDTPFDIEFADTDVVRFSSGSTYSIAYMLVGADSSTEIEVLAQDGLHARVERTDESTGLIVVTTPLSIVERSAVIVLVSDGRGKTMMKSLNFVFDGSLDPNNGVLIITTAEPFVVGAAGGTVSVPLQTNLNYRVEIASDAASWLRLTPATRAALREETLTFTADANTSAMRRAFVYLIDLATESIAQTLCITQSGDEKALAETIRFVDPNFEKIILNNYDLDGDGKISKGEALEIISLDVPNKNITDLTGLEWFTNLISLDVSRNSIKTLDVSKLTALERLTCYNCSLTDVDLKSNKALKYLDCSSNNLTRLVLSQNKALTYLNCAKQPITVLDLSNNTELQDIRCFGNSRYLQTLKIPNCAKLKKLYCSNQNLSSINLSGCSELNELDISANKLSTLDISRNTKLIKLDCYSNAISSLNLSANPQLKDVSVALNPLTTLDLGNNFESFELGVYYSIYSSLRVSAPSLKTLSCVDSSNSGSFLNKIDLSGCPKLENLSVKSIIGENIDISMLKSLKTLRVEYCENITSLDLSANTELTSLTCYYVSSLKDLDISANLKLRSLTLSNTAIESIDVSKYESLQSIFVAYTPLHYLNLGDNPFITSFGDNNSTYGITATQIKITGSRLKQLTLDKSSDLRELDVTECPALESLTFKGKVTEIDLSKNPMLKTLTCQNGSLESLDLTANTALETLQCYKNKLRSLDVTNCKNLTTLSCGSNFLETLDVSGNLSMTSLNCSSMASLQTLFMDSSQRIRYITYERNTSYIPAQTEIVYR